MAKKANKTAGSNILTPGVINSILDSAREMLEEHREEIHDTLEESDKRAVTVNLGVQIDASESAAAVKVGIRFASTVTDSRSFTCDDPSQERFDIMTPEALKDSQEKADKERKKLEAKEAKEAAKKSKADGE